MTGLILAMALLILSGATALIGKQPDNFLGLTKKSLDKLAILLLCLSPLLGAASLYYGHNASEREKQLAQRIDKWDSLKSEHISYFFLCFASDTPLDVKDTITCLSKTKLTFREASSADPLDDRNYRVDFLDEENFNDAPLVTTSILAENSLHDFDDLVFFLSEDVAKNFTLAMRRNNQIASPAIQSFSRAELDSAGSSSGFICIIPPIALKHLPPLRSLDNIALMRTAELTYMKHDALTGNQAFVLCLVLSDGTVLSVDPSEWQSRDGISETTKCISGSTAYSAFRECYISGKAKTIESTFFKSYEIDEFLRPIAEEVGYKLWPVYPQAILDTVPKGDVVEAVFGKEPDNGSYAKLVRRFEREDIRNEARIGLHKMLDHEYPNDEFNDEDLEPCVIWFSQIVAIAIVDFSLQEALKSKDDAIMDWEETKLEWAAEKSDWIISEMRRLLSDGTLIEVLEAQEPEQDKDFVNPKE